MLPSSHSFQALGLMSGSSLDGLDIAFCTFTIDTDGSYQLPQVSSWSILQAATLPYPDTLISRLKEAIHLSGLELCRLNAEYGQLIGQMANDFIRQHQLEPDLIASHGHTIFHYPELSFTLQIGDGAAIAETIGIKTIVDLRSQDIAAGGQGAPLAPLADALLLPGQTYYLNLGGIANITAKTATGYVAFDICGANQILNTLVAELNLPYDDKGELARTGNIVSELYEQQCDLEFFRKAYPKSLDNNWVRQQQSEVFLAFPASIPDKLHTACRLIARQIALHIDHISQRENLPKRPGSLLISGGGAYNDFLVECIAEALPNVTITIPDEQIIGFKEAALMALMGCLRQLELPNCLASVTGAGRNTCGGVIYEAPARMSSY